MQTPGLLRAHKADFDRWIRAFNLTERPRGYSHPARHKRCRGHRTAGETRRHIGRKRGLIWQPRSRRPTRSASVTDEASFAKRRSKRFGKGKEDLEDEKRDAGNENSASSLSGDLKRGCLTTREKKATKPYRLGLYYTVVYMINRYRPAETTVNVRHILIGLWSRRARHRHGRAEATRKLRRTVFDS
jgi:hypothetical protein